MSGDNLAIATTETFDEHDQFPCPLNLTFSLREKALMGRTGIGGLTDDPLLQMTWDPLPAGAKERTLREGEVVVGKFLENATAESIAEDYDFHAPST